MKDIFHITRENLEVIKTNPDDGVKYLEEKLANTINPVHVKAIQILKSWQSVVSS